MAEKVKRSPLVSDAPVGLHRDLLWQGSAMQFRIQEIVDAILLSEDPLTFAIHGPWGSGKTSLLRMIEDSIEARHQDQTIHVCWYNASAYQSVCDNAKDASVTVALRILDTLSGGDPQKSARLYLNLVRSFHLGHWIESETKFDIEEGGLADIEGGPRPFSVLQILAEKMAMLADLGKLLNDYLQGRGPFESGKSKLVLVIDDLDRCSLEFIGNVIEAAQRLSAVPRLFVVISIDKVRLWRALERRFEDVMDTRGVRWAAEKYVQYTVELPLLDESQLESFLKNLLGVPEKDPSNEPQSTPRDEASLAIATESRYFAVGIPHKTPRLIKRCINYIYPQLSNRLAQGESLSEDVRQRIIKEQLLTYVWSEFYVGYWIPALKGQYPALAVCPRVEDACRRYVQEIQRTPPDRWDEIWASFEHVLRKIRASEGLTDKELDVPLELARLLGTSPYFFGRGGIGQTWEKPSQSTGPYPYRSVDFEQKIQMGPSLDEEFTAYYIRSEQADATGDGRASVQAAAQALELVRRNRQGFGKSIAPQLGNLGVNAEKHRALELAEQIWRLALEFDPEHSGTLQQFASYIIDNRPDLYPEAEEILNRLQTGSHVAEKPWRTLSLLVQLKSALNQPLDANLVERLTSAAETETDAVQLGHILSAVIRAGQFRQGLSLFASTVDRFTSMKSRYTLQRIVADALANRPEADNEFIAMDLYRQILARPEVIDPGDEPHVMHNYATLLYKHDYDDEAGCLWFKACQLPSGIGDSGIRRAYSMYLLRADRGDLAEKIISGNSINEMVALPTERELPEQFSDIDLPDPFRGSELPRFRCLEPVRPSTTSL
jgi:tetratricopeptide (TPR) repeat protein